MVFCSTNLKNYKFTAQFGLNIRSKRDGAKILHLDSLEECLLRCAMGNRCDGVNYSAESGRCKRIHGYTLKYETVDAESMTFFSKKSGMFGVWWWSDQTWIREVQNLLNRLSQYENESPQNKDLHV